MYIEELFIGVEEIDRCGNEFGSIKRHDILSWKAKKKTY